VPIIKIVTTQNVNIDIAYGSKPTNTLIVKGYTRKYHFLRPLVLFLKQLLAQHDLNIPFSGGIGSYGLVLMVTNVLQRFYSKRKEHCRNEEILAELLISFLKFYGSEFDYYKYAITVDRGMISEREDRGECLVIIDPSNPSNEIGRNAFQLMEIKKLFVDTLRSLESDDDKQPCPTILSKIINVKN